MNSEQFIDKQPHEAASVIGNTVARTLPVTKMSDSEQPSGNIRMLVISWLDEEDEKRIVLRPGQSTTFGRLASHADHPVPTDPCISGLHFRLECQSDSVRLTDEGSTNGTFVNGERCKAIVVFDGALIAAGMTVFQLQVSFEG